MYNLKHKFDAQKVRVVLIVLCALVITGCAVDKKQEVSTYRKVLTKNVPKQTAAYKPGQPLSLAQALELTNQTNDQLAVQGENYLQALINKDRAVSSFLPTISLAPTYMMQAQTHAQGVPPDLLDKFAPTQSLDVPIQGQISLNPLESINQSDQAGNTAAARKQALLALQSKILLDTAQTYYQILRAQAQVKVLTKSLAVQTLRVNNIIAKHKVGAARPLDVSQSQAQQSATKGLLIQAKNNVKNGRAMLAMLIGAQSVKGTLNDSFEVPSKILSQKALMQIAYTNRYNLKAAKQNILAAQSGVKAAWSQYFPSITLNASYFLHRETFPNDINWMSSISVNIPLFSAGMIYQDVRTSLSQLRQAEHRAKHQLKEVRKQVKQAHNNMVNNGKRIAQLQVQVKAAQQAFRRASAAYDVGATTNLERLTTLQQLLRAQLSLTFQQFSRKTLYLTLQQVVGKLTLKTVTSSRIQIARSQPTVIGARHKTVADINNQPNHLQQ